MRKIKFSVGEYYHIYNRGVDKRAIFLDENDVSRFFQSMEDFNQTETVGSIYEYHFAKRKLVKSGLGSEASKSKCLVDFIAYCLNQNHFHFILTPLQENGVQKFMQRLGTGYTKYFNTKHGRSGALFQGVFKAVHIKSNRQLLYVSAYVNLNDHVHQLGSEASKLVRSSIGEYTRVSNGFCKKNIILEQFSSPNKYLQYARETLAHIQKRRENERNLTKIFLEA